MHLALMGTTCIRSPRKRWERFPNGITYTSILATLINSQLPSQPIFIWYFLLLIVGLLAYKFVWVLFPFCLSLVFSSSLDFFPTRLFCLYSPHFWQVVLCPTTAEPHGSSSTRTRGFDLGLSCSGNVSYRSVLGQQSQGILLRQKQETLVFLCSSILVVLLMAQFILS